METLLRRLKSANPRKLDALAQFAQIEYTQQFKHFISKEREINKDIFFQFYLQSLHVIVCSDYKY